MNSHLYVPWVSLAEVRRTLQQTIIKEDLGFRAKMMRFAVLEMHRGALTKADLSTRQRLTIRAKDVEAAALQAVDADIALFQSKVQTIDPCGEAVTQTLQLFQAKRLAPFDEMILGAVLAQAKTLCDHGETGMWFCSLNTKNFDPARNTSSGLAALYAKFKIQFRGDFEVP